MARNEPGGNVNSKGSDDEDGGGATERNLLTVSQAASYLHLSPSSIRSYIRQGTLKAFRVAGLRKVRIARAELLTLLRPAIESDSPDSVEGEVDLFTAR